MLFFNCKPRAGKHLRPLTLNESCDLFDHVEAKYLCLLYTSPSPRD